MPTPTPQEWQDALNSLQALEISVLEDFITRFESFKIEMSEIIAGLPNAAVKSPLQTYFERFGAVMNGPVANDLRNLMIHYGLEEGEPINLPPMTF